eukprot:9915511-Ditylum_brightwellii.AAC.1
MMTTSTEFRVSIKDQQKKWMMGELKIGYKYNNLMLYTLKLYNDQRALDKWDKEMATKLTKKKDKSPKFIALITELKKKIKKLDSGLQTTPTPKDEEKPKKIH